MSDVTDIVRSEELTPSGLVYVRHNLGSLKGKRRSVFFAAEVLAVNDEKVSVKFLTHHNVDAVVTLQDCWRIARTAPSGDWKPSANDVVLCRIVENLDGQSVNNYCFYKIRFSNNNNKFVSFRLWQVTHWSVGRVVNVDNATGAHISWLDVTRADSRVVVRVFVFRFSLFVCCFVC